MGAVGYRDPSVRDRAPRATLRGRAVPERPGNQDPRPAALHLVGLAIGKRSVIGLRGAAGLPAAPVSAEVPPDAGERRLLPRGWKREAGRAQLPILAPREPSGSGTSREKDLLQTLNDGLKDNQITEAKPSLQFCILKCHKYCIAVRLLCP